MLSIEALFFFVGTTLIVVLSPGPAVIAVTSEAMTNGFRRSFWLIFGVAVANVIFFVLSATGIAALIVASSSLFSAIKWVGVAYLMYLGSKAMFSKSGPIKLHRNKNIKIRRSKNFYRGFSLEIANPKALLYFTALLPQFIDPAYPMIPQLAVFCIITFILDISCYSFYAYIGMKSLRFKKNPTVTKLMNQFSGAMLMFVGMRMATIER